jgi:streptomycin 6-kinase
MPDDRPSDERQREYEQIKQDLMRRGRGAAEAEAIAARTVSRQRSEEHSPAAAEAPSEHSYRELYAQAKARGIAGRSTMSKKELERRLAG